jgi:peptide/nickel transport system permease protein
MNTLLTSWFARRIAAALLVAWAVSSIIFLTIRFLPGQPAERLLSRDGAAPSAAAIAQLNAQLGLDRSVPVQYLRDFRNVLIGNFGRSLQDGRPVGEAIARRLPRTLELLIVAALLATLISVPIGAFAAFRPLGTFDNASTALFDIVRAIPVFALGALLLLLFTQPPHPTPAWGYVALTDDPVQHLELLALPAFTIALTFAAPLFRMTRNAVLEVSQKNFVRAARARGLGSARVMLRHVLPNALIPILAALPRQFALLLGATVLVEFLFGYPGLSGLLATAVTARDYPEVQGIILVMSVLFIALKLSADLLYGALDPRARIA